MQIWYELAQIGSPGLSLDELVDKVRPRVPVGYAWRRYLRQRNAERRRSHEQAPNGHLALAPIADTPGNRLAAIRYVVRNSVDQMVRRNSAIKRPDGRYAVGPRKPRSVFTDEQHDFDGSLSRRHVADMQLMRVLTGPNGVIEAIQVSRARQPKTHLPAISVPLAAALERWAEAHAPTRS